MMEKLAILWTTDNEETALNMKEGVNVMACQICAERYGLVDQIKDMGIEVKLMGEPLTVYLQDESYWVITV